VVDLDTLTVMEFRKSGTSGIARELFGKDVEARLAKPIAIDRTLDDVDLALIRELVHDGRSTFVDLAPKVGLSQAGVRARVQRLLEEQVVVIQAFPSAEVLGIASFATLLLSVRGPMDPIVEKLCGMSEFTVVALAGGSFDLVCEVWCRDNEHLLETLDTVRALDGVGVVQSNTYLEIIKEDYLIG
jgi:Lrp/AsnC family transcriptional regulator for asnA, asnC and gidA